MMISFRPLLIGCNIIGWFLLSLALSLGYESGVRQVLDLKHIPFPIIMLIVLIYKLLQNDMVKTAPKDMNDAYHDTEVIIKGIVTPLISVIIMGIIHLIAIL